MEAKQEVKKSSSLKLQKGLSVLLVLISLVAFMANSHVAWGLLFFAGIGWFVVIRIME